MPVLLWTVAPSVPHMQEGVTTVGFVHRALAATVSSPGTSAFFWICATVWLSGPIGSAWNAPPRHTPWDWFPLAATMSFLVVMPFSYMPWEKYALPLFMAAGPLLLTGRSSGAGGVASGLALSAGPFCEPESKPEGRIREALKKNPG